MQILYNYISQDRHKLAPAKSDGRNNLLSHTFAMPKDVFIKSDLSFSSSNKNTTKFMELFKDCFDENTPKKVLKLRKNVLNAVDKNIDSLNENSADNIRNIVSNIETPEQAKVAIKILLSGRLSNNDKFMDNAWKIILNVDTPAEVKLKTGVIDKILSSEKLYNNDKVMNNAAEIIYVIKTKEQAKMAQKILSSERLFSNDEIIKSAGEIIFTTKTKEQAEAKMDIIYKMINHPDFPKEYIGSIASKCDEDNLQTKLNMFKILNKSDYPKEFIGYILININKTNEKEMLSRINESQCRENQNEPNLTHLLSKEFHDVEKLDRKLLKFPKINRNIGTIPDGWLNNVSKIEQKEVAKIIFDILAEFAKINATKNKDIDNLSDNLEKALSKGVKIDYVGEGAFGICYKISIGGKNYLLKTFIERPKGYCLHGSGAEIQAGIYANNHARENQFAKFYFGRVTGSIYDDGFMINEFIEVNSKKSTPTKKNNPIIESAPLYIDYVYSPDKEMSLQGFSAHNTINGEMIDYGNFQILNSTLANPKTRQTFRIFAERIYKKTYKNGYVEYVLSDANKKILLEYANKNLSESEFRDACDYFISILENHSQAKEALEEIRQ